MSRRQPVSTRAIAQLVAAALVATATIVLLAALRSSAPEARLEFLGEASPPGRGEEAFVTCERTLPDRPTLPEGAAPPEPVGPVRSADVMSCPDLFDGRTVTYTGEVVGDVLDRDGGAWVLMNDDAYALESGPLPAHREFRGGNTGLSVWLPDQLVELADTPGRPGQRGDVLRVRGRINRVDPADGGGLTLRAFDADVVAEAAAVEVPVHTAQVAVAGVFAALAVLAVLLQRRQAQRR